MANKAAVRANGVREGMTQCADELTEWLMRNPSPLR